MLDVFKKYITVKNVIFFIIAILFIIFVTKIKDIAILFFASFVISCSLNPIVDNLASKKIKRPFAAGIVLGGVLLVALLFILPLAIMTGHEIKAFVDNIPDYADNLKTFITQVPFINKSTIVKPDITSLISSATNFTSTFVNGSISAGMGFATGIIYFLAACIIIYYFLSDKDEVRNAYLSLFPKNMKNRAEEIIEAISQKIGGYVIAQVVTMSSVGVIMTIGLLILGVEYAVLLGLMTAILDIIPVVGPGIALIITLLASYKMGALTLGLILVVFIIAQWAENNLVRPFIFSKFLDLHPLIIYFFLFVTAQYLGVIGVIFAPAIAATVCVLIDELYIKTIN